jgi:hypothetical protein
VNFVDIQSETNAVIGLGCEAISLLPAALRKLLAADESQGTSHAARLPPDIPARAELMEVKALVPLRQFVVILGAI